MNKVKISRTIYTVVSREENEKYITCKIKKGNTEKTLIHHKRWNSWQLWSGRNGINSYRNPKSCQPEFLTEEEAELLPKPKKRASTTFSSEIKKALKQAFPSVKFSVTYKVYYGYLIAWQDGIQTGATFEAVKAIADNWSTHRNISDDPYEPSYVGDPVRYEHEITDNQWREFVAEQVVNSYGNGNIYNARLDCFTTPDGNRSPKAHYENEDYENWLHNGIKCDLESDRSRIDKELYYEFDAPKQEKESKAVDLDSSQDQEIENKDQIIPLAINYNTRTVKAKFATDGCKNSIQDYLELCSNREYTNDTNIANWNLEECVVQEEIILNPEDYDFFTQNLLNHYEFLANKGGYFSTAPELKQADDNYINWTEEQLEIFDATKYRKCVSVSAKDRKEILVDPQSIYGSVSFIGLVEPESTEKPTSNNVDSSPEIEHEEEEKSLNWYEQKQQDRKERYLARAGKAQRESNAYYQSSHDETKHIPFGQPILRHHHSENAHRRALKASWDKMGKSVKAQEKSEYYLAKAAGVGTGGISSDDPDAIIKLTKQLEEAIARQEKMKVANKLIRKQDKTGLAKMGYSEREITSLFTPDFCGRIGYPSFELTNNNANIRRLKTRIKELGQAAELKTEEFVYDGLTVVHNSEENRVQLIFESIPSKDFRQLLKSRGFRWSRVNRAWQRQLNDNGIYAAKCIKDQFLEL